MYLSIVKLTIDVDLSFGNVACQIRNRVSNIWKTKEGKKGKLNNFRPNNQQKQQMNIDHR